MYGKYIDDCKDLNLTNNVLTKIQTSDLTVIENGSGSIVFQGTSVTFEFNDLKLKIEFLNDCSTSSPRCEISRLSNKKKIVVNCFNFLNMFGTATAVPLMFAKSSQTNIALYVNLAVYKIVNSYVLHYTFLEGEEING